MRQVLLTTVIIILMAGCKHSQSQRISVYDAIRNVISFQPTAILVADSIFARWEKRQTDAEKIKYTREKYEKIKKAAIEGLESIEKSVDLAEEAGKPIDKRDLQSKINALVKELLDFALSLEDAVVGSEPVPASQPNS